jgi:AbrB family looped-hinge helix DNA binding protein
MSSRGQVVIPEGIRAQLHLKPGTEFVVVAKENVLVFQRLPSPSWEQFEGLIREAGRQARASGLKPRGAKPAAAKVPGRR